MPLYRVQLLIDKIGEGPTESAHVHVGNFALPSLAAAEEAANKVAALFTAPTPPKDSEPAKVA